MTERKIFLIIIFFCFNLEKGAGLHYSTHVATSLAAGTYLTTVTNVPFSVACLGGIVIGSLLPDIDEPNSFVGRRTFGLSKLIKKTFGHRGLTHSLLFWLLFSLLYYKFQNDFTLGLSLGYVFHIIGDFFSRQGVPLFFPFTKKKFRAPLTYKTGTVQERALLVVALVAFVYIVYRYKLFVTVF